MQRLLVWCVFVLWASSALGSDILLISSDMFASPSLYMFLSTITGGLVAKGHNVTIVSNDIKKDTGFPNGTFSQVLYFRGATHSSNDRAKYGAMLPRMAYGTLDLIEYLQLYTRIAKPNYQSCRDLWTDTRIIDLLKHNSRFDLVIVCPLSSCGVLVAHYLDVPFVVAFHTIRSPLFYEGFIGMPYPSSYVPLDIHGHMTDEMTFFERLKNLIYYPLAYDICQHFSNAPYHQIQEQFEIHPEKSVKELYQKTSLTFPEVSLSSDFPRPYTLNYIPVGGLVAHPIQPLSKEISDFVEGSGEHGVIIFSLGSILGALNDVEMVDTFAKVFSKLHQRVLWRHNGRPPSSLGHNTRLVKWLPQNDLLGHPKIRLLIYHGGASGIGEAIYHGVPMVIIPLWGDQFTNAARVQKKGMGVTLSKTNITEENLMVAVKDVLENPRYKERAQLFSELQIDDSLAKAVHWIEHVIQFGDAHFRSRSADMGLIELYHIDVTAFLFLISVVALYVNYVILSKCCSSC